MDQIKKKCRIWKHVVCLLGACLLSCGILFFTKNSLPDVLPSECYEDLRMPSESSSILDRVTIKAVNSRINNLHVTAKKKDARIILKFEDNKAVKIRSIKLALKESFPYNVACTLYYRNPSGEYVEECKVAVTLPKGMKDIYFQLPDDVTYPLKQFRIDIDDDYVIEDVRISEHELEGEYQFAEHADWKKAGVIYFFVWLVLLELAYFSWPYLSRRIAGYWTNQNNAHRFWLAAFGVLAIGNAAAYVGLRLLGKAFPWYWALLLSLCGVIAAYQVYLLRKKTPGMLLIKKREDTGKIHALFWVGIVVFILLIAFEWIDGAEEAPEIAEKVRFIFPFVFAVLETVLLALLYRKYVLDVQEDSISFQSIYLFVFLLLGTAYLLVFLPYVSPDEPAHFFSAYHVSNLLMGKNGHWGDGRLLMRMEDYVLYDQHQTSLNSEYYMQFTEGIRLFAREQGYVVMDGLMTTNAIFSYLTTGIGITVARLLHLSGALTFFAGRFANLLFFTWVLRYLMKKIPFGRTALFGIVMMPMTLHMVASYSYDVTTFCIIALFVTQVMSMICSPEKISRRDYLLCIFFGILMAPSKLVYIPLLFLVLLIPGEKLAKSRKEAWGKKIFVIGVSIAAAMVIMLLVSLLSKDSPVGTALEGDEVVNMLSWISEPSYTLPWIFGHIWEYILMCIRTLISQMDYYFYTMVGVKLGWLNIDIPYSYAVISFILFLLAVNIRDDVSSQVRIGLGKKIWILLLGAGTVLCTMVVMTVSWTPVSYNYVSGVQGRYILPLLVPFIWVMKTYMVQVNSVIRKHIVFFSTMLNIWILVYVFSHYMIMK